MKKILSFLLMAVLCLGSATMAFADSGVVGNTGKTDSDAYNFTLFTDGDHLYIHQGSPVQSRMGGGIGRCKQTYKTFYRSFSREQAQAALDAEELGQGYVKALGKLLTWAGGDIGEIVDEVFGYFGGDDAFVSQLKEFLASGKSTASFIFKTRCVNRGHMYGDPMYDYAVEDVSMSY